MKDFCERCVIVPSAPHFIECTLANYGGREQWFLLHPYRF